MARFPIRESEIQTLAQNIATGLAGHPAVFPAPPVAPADIQAALDAFVARSDAFGAAKALALQASQDKDVALELLVKKMKAALRYAETAVNRSDADLSLLGWGGHAKPHRLQPPGQPQRLRAPEQGESAVTLTWKEPPDGGTVATYAIERREPAVDWHIVAVATTTETTLENQARNTPLEFRVIAINKAGQSPPSNTAAAVL